MGCKNYSGTSKHSECGLLTPDTTIMVYSSQAGPYRPIQGPWYEFWDESFRIQKNSICCNEIACIFTLVSDARTQLKEVGVQPSLYVYI